MNQNKSSFMNYFNKNIKIIYKPGNIKQHIHLYPIHNSQYRRLTSISKIESYQISYPTANCLIIYIQTMLIKPFYFNSYTYFHILLLIIITLLMLRATKRKNLSFYEFQLSNSYQRYQKMAQIQSKLIFNDLTNNQLITQIDQLKAENHHLRQKILDKEMKETAIAIKYSKKSSTPKMFDQNQAAQKSTIKALKQLYRQDHKNNYPDLSSIPTQLASKKKKCQCDCTREGSVILDKNVYMDRGLRERPQSLNISCDQGIQIKNKAKQFRSSLSNPKKQNNQSKFPGELNEFQGRQAQSRFMQCHQIPKERDDGQEGEMNRWKSQGKMSFKNESGINYKSGQIKKRKFFLSLVSVSSCEGRKSKIN